MFVSFIPFSLSSSFSDSFSSFFLIGREFQNKFQPSCHFTSTELAYISFKKRKTGRSYVPTMPLSQTQKLKIISWCHGTTHIPISLRVSVRLLPRGLWEWGFPQGRYTAWLRSLLVSFNLGLPPPLSLGLALWRSARSVCCRNLCPRIHLFASSLHLWTRDSRAVFSLSWNFAPKNPSGSTLNLLRFSFFTRTFYGLFTPGCLTPGCPPLSDAPMATVCPTFMYWFPPW